MINQKNQKKGFTIIETIVAIGIFGIGILALLGFYTYSSQVVRFARQTTVASNLAQGLVEQTISEPYDTLTVGESAKETFSIIPTDSSYGYSKQTKISLIDQNLNASDTDVGLKKIDCTVYWQSNWTEKNIQVSTIVTRR